MNILPKKRWHVRTKENIARVRRDEAEAAEKERLEQLRIQKADQEARLVVLKAKSKQKLEESNVTETSSIPLKPEHINFFEDIEHAVQTTNKEHDKEITSKQEEYEKKIGYLTYLGQDTNEALGKKNWYDVPPETSRFSRGSEIKDTYEKLILKDADGKAKVKEGYIQNGEVDYKTKQKQDPLNLFSQYLSKVEKKSTKTELTVKNNKKAYKHSSKDETKADKLSKLQKMREVRLRREQEERKRTEAFLSGKSESRDSTPAPSTSRVKPKYNSQFNPELAAIIRHFYTDRIIPFENNKLYYIV